MAYTKQGKEKGGRPFELSKSPPIKFPLPTNAIEREKSRCEN